jgi:hypothetical protein
MMVRWLAALLLALAVTAAGAPRAAAQPAPRRYAVVVGANHATPGRRELRYAHNDAQAVADILIRLGRFGYDDVNVLLDPDPRQVLAALDAILKRETAEHDATLFFYYSGHADQEALYPNGQPLSLKALRARLDDERVRVRVGVIDACRGGGWTGAKGLTPAPPFPVEWPVVLSNHGSVLIASSSGFEDAHESEVLRGSFFTHHWNAGLRGAADQNGDGTVTASEAFEYAQGLTIRDTALVAEAPQHPSFRIDLSGRRDVTLVTLDRSNTTLTLEQASGPLQLLHLETGLIVLESPRGRQSVRLSVRPGRYLVRRTVSGEVRAREIDLGPERSVTVRESELEPAPSVALAAKGAGERALAAPIVAARSVELSLALGVRHAPVIDPGLRVGVGGEGAIGLLRASVGLGGGWQLMAPLAVALGAGSGQPWDWVAWAGAPVLSINRSDAEGTAFAGLVGGGLDARRRLGTQTTFNASATVLGAYTWTTRVPDAAVMASSRRGVDTWSVQLSGGLTRYVSDSVSLSLGFSAAHNLAFHGDLAPWDAEDPRGGVVLGIGSLQRRGLRPLPLVRVYLSDKLAIDGHVAVAYLPATNAVVETYLAGVTALLP